MTNGIDTEPKLAMIAALSQNGVIGCQGQLPWHYPADLKRFAKTTRGAPMIMGRKTWDSLPKKPLPGRPHIVLSRTPAPKDLPAGVAWTNSWAAAWRAACDAWSASAGSYIWVIGGADLFALAMPHAAHLDLTFVPDEISTQEGLVFFPQWDESVWSKISSSPLPEDPRLLHQTFERQL